MDGRPGRAVAVIGTLVAVLGVIVIVVAFVSRPYGSGGLGTDGLFVGGLTLVCGLLLRIEAAVTTGARAPSDGSGHSGRT